MTTKTTAAHPASGQTDGAAGLLRQYGCGAVEFTGADSALYERHLVFDHVVKLAAAGPRDPLSRVPGATK